MTRGRMASRGGAAARDLASGDRKRGRGDGHGARGEAEVMEAPQREEDERMITGRGVNEGRTRLY